MDLDTFSNRRELISVFPDLAGDPNFVIASPKTWAYNCIAWAMGFENRWVASTNTPGLIPPPADKAAIRFVWWPAGVEVSRRREALEAAFVALGFERVRTPEYEPTYDKVVLYADGTGWTHASRIVADGIEHSKFGGLWDGRHGHNMFNNSPYGTPYAYMRRLHALKQHYIDLHPIKIGRITINEARLGETIRLLKKTRGI